MALCGAAGIWTAFWVVAGRCGQTPNDAAGVRTHIENNVFEFERHGATRRGAALRIRCATPFTLFVEGVNGCLLDHCQVSSVPNYCGFIEQKISEMYTVGMVIYWNSNVNILIFEILIFDFH